MFFEHKTLEFAFSLSREIRAKFGDTSTRGREAYRDEMERRTNFNVCLQRAIDQRNKVNTLKVSPLLRDSGRNMCIRRGIPTFRDGSTGAAEEGRAAMEAPNFLPA